MLVAVRSVRKSASLPFLDPNVPLTSRGELWRYSDDGISRRPVLQRGSPGMSHMGLNSPSMDFVTVNSLYMKLRDAEVNTLQRFAVLTQSDQVSSVLGLDPTLLLLVGETLQSTSEGSVEYSTAQKVLSGYMRNMCDLAYLMFDFQKPLITNISTVNSGMCGLANCASSNKTSSTVLGGAAWSLPPVCGASYILSRLAWPFGLFAGASGSALSGNSMYFSRCTGRWVPREAFESLELLASEQLDLSESRGFELLQDYFTSPDKDWDMEALNTCLSQLFKEPTMLLDELMTVAKYASALPSSQSITPDQSALLSKCVDSIKSLSDPKNEVMRESLGLVLSLMRYRSKLEADLTDDSDPSARPRLNSRGKRGSELVSLDTYIYSADPGSDEFRKRKILVESLVLRKALAMESDLMEKVLKSSRQSLYGLYQLATGEKHKNETRPSLVDGIGQSVETQSVKSIRVDESVSSFVPTPRVWESPVSEHPLARQYHPSYSSKTGLDYDPIRMHAELIRFGPDYLVKDIDFLRNYMVSQSRIANGRDKTRAVTRR